MNKLNSNRKKMSENWVKMCNTSLMRKVEIGTRESHNG